MSMMTLGCGPSGPRVSVITDGLVGRWFTTNAATDLSGGGNTATLVGGATYSTDVPAGAFPFPFTHSLSLSSDGDYANVGNSATLNPGTTGGAMTFCCWVKRAANNSGFYCGRGGGSAAYSFGNLVDNQVLFSILAASVVNGSGSNVADTWTHCLWTGSDASGVWECYVNGVLADSDAWRAAGASSDDTNIGRGENNNALTAVGLIGDARIYNRKLTSTEAGKIGTGIG